MILPERHPGSPRVWRSGATGLYLHQRHLEYPVDKLILVSTVGKGIGRVSMRDIFTSGMQRWFALKGFQVGIPTEGIDQSLGFEDFQSRVKDFGKLTAALGGGVRVLQRAGRFGGLARTVGRWGGAVGAVGAAISLSDLLIDTGATADDLYDALKPYASRADLIGLKISDARVPNTLKENPRNKTFWNTVLIPVIYADDLTPDSIARRFDKFLGAAASLKRLGLRAKLVGNRASVYPLLVYFDGEKLEEDKELLWPQVFEEEGTGRGIRPLTRTDRSSWVPGLKAKLSAGVVNVPEGWVLSEVFDEDDLYSVLRWGEEGSSGSD